MVNVGNHYWHQNLELFMITFQCILGHREKNIDLKESHIFSCLVLIWPSFCHNLTSLSVNDLLHRDGRFGSIVGQIGPKLDKSVTFSDQISVHFHEKRTGFVQFWSNLTDFWSQSVTPAPPDDS